MSKKRPPSKYELYYDDSSSEEEEKQVFEDYSAGKLEFGINKTKENLRSHCKHFYNKNDNAFNQNLDLSFIIHEIAINLIKSPKIGESFFPLKKDLLKENIVLPEGLLKEICKKSITDTLKPQKVKKEKIESFINDLVYDKRAFVKSVESGNLSYFYPFTNPLSLKIETVRYPTSSSLKSKIISLCQQPDLKDCNQLTKKIKNKNQARVINYDKVYLSVPQTSVEQFLKDKLINLRKTTTLGDFIKEIQDSPELKNALDSKQEEFRKALYTQIQENLKEASTNVMRATLPKHFDYEIRKDDFTKLSNELIALGRLMTTSFKRAYKNADRQDSLLGSTESSFFRKVTLGQVALLESQLLYKATGSRSDYVDIETQGKGGAYKNIASTIMNIKSKLQIGDKLIAQWILDTLKSKQDIFSKYYNPKQESELKEFISTLTYLLFGTEAVRNPASLIIHQMMLELIISSNKDWTFLKVFTTDDGETSGGKMPMSQERIKNPDVGAVDVSRFMHKVFQTTMKYSYDKAPINPVFSRNNLAYKFLQKMINLEATVIKDWMYLKKVNIEDNDKTKLYEELLEACEMWYGIVPMRQLIVDNINDFDFSDEDLDSISEFSVKDLYILRDMLQNKSSEVNFLLEHSVSLDRIKKIYAKDAENDTNLLNEVINQEAWSIIENNITYDADEVVKCIKKHGTTHIKNKYTEYTKRHNNKGNFGDHLSSTTSENSESEDTEASGNNSFCDDSV